VTCPSCSAENLPEARHCASCGVDLPTEASVSDATSDVTSALPASDAAAADPAATQAVATVGSQPAQERLRCPHCGAANSPRRELCGRCGTDLRTGETPRTRDVVVPGPVPDTPERRTADLVGRVVAMVIGVGVLLGALIGGLVALTTGSGSPDDATVPPVPVFDRSVYDGEPVDLPVAAIGATTTADPAGDTTFAASNMVDADLSTAWNNDAADNPTGIGEVIAVEFDGPVWVTALVLANGSQSDDSRFLGDARVRRARVAFDGGEAVEVTFLDQQGLQEVGFDPPRLTTGLRITVLEVYPGDTYDELAISQLRVEGYDARGEDAEVARQRASGEVVTGPGTGSGTGG
jgi:hypothetical protein